MEKQVNMQRNTQSRTEEARKRQLNESIHLIRIEQKRRKRVRKKFNRQLSLILSPIFPQDISLYISDYVHLKIPVSEEISHKMKKLYPAI